MMRLRKRVASMIHRQLLFSLEYTNFFLAHLLMSPLVTSRSAVSPKVAKRFSRVTSFKREWQDDEGSTSQNGLKGSSREIEWSLSPEQCVWMQIFAWEDGVLTLTYRLRQRAVCDSTSSSTMTPVPPGPTETAADRRRTAILASMSQNTQPTKPSVASAYDLDSSSHVNMPSSSRGAAHAQQLLSVPSSSAHPAINSRKRELPWEEDIVCAARLQAKLIAEEQ